MAAKMILLQLFFCACINAVFSQDLGTFSNCCPYCAGEQPFWMKAEPTWQLMVGSSEDLITKFQEPAGYVVDDQVQGETELFGRIYHIDYAGIPVYLEVETGLSNAGAILNGQYIEINLERMSSITAIELQGGYYGDSEDELIDMRRTWITSFAVSYAVSGTSFAFLKSSSGAVHRFVGNYNSEDSAMINFDKVINAKAIRVHPLEARDESGPTREVLARVSVIKCVTGYCSSPRVNCNLREWQSWGECTCSEDECTQKRERGVASYSACGGDPCGQRRDRQACTPPTPMWQVILQWAGIGVAGLLAIIILSVIIHKKCRKEPTVVFEKQVEKRQKKNKKSRKVEDQSLAEENMDNNVLGDDEYNDSVENQANPALIPPAVKEPKPVEKKAEPQVSQPPPEKKTNPLADPFGQDPFNARSGPSLDPEPSEEKKESKKVTFGQTSTLDPFGGADDDEYDPFGDYQSSFA